MYDLQVEDDSNLLSCGETDQTKTTVIIEQCTESLRRQLVSDASCLKTQNHARSCDAVGLRQLRKRKKT